MPSADARGHSLQGRGHGQEGSSSLASLLLAICGLAIIAALAGACEKLPNVPPSAGFIYSPVSPILAGSTVVVFNASSSRDSDGNIASYVWNFGDGTPEQPVNAATLTHVFPDTPATCTDITYAVLLIVVDNGGDRGFASQTVTVIEDCPR